MTLHQKITSARKSKGLTQEELADLTNITVRTIQRIESGESIPRTYTIKAIAKALDLPFGSLINEGIADTAPAVAAGQVSLKEEDGRHFLQVFCLSAFSYIVVPYVHFLIPAYLLKKRKEENIGVIRFAKKFIRGQITWVIITHLLFLMVVVYDLLMAAYFNKKYAVYFLWPFFIMYFVNAISIVKSLAQIKQMDFDRANHK
ncbi:MAG: helix-turn-helix domain-containing protein [Chitinophagaceae bacterium]